ncbi:transposable element Tcb1 transposase [Trichonephila clavipes]|nr:transposable element Tcb1 transposase [Trichonephila clavipes]
MSNFSNVKRGMIIGACPAGAFMSGKANLVVVSGITVSRIMIAYTNLGKVSFAKHNSGQISKLKDYGRQLLKRIVDQRRKTTLQHISPR